MIESVSISNFQSHCITKLFLDKGVNVITGTSNSGKTAILRAINWVVNNRPLGDGYMREGSAAPTEVCLTVEEGDLVTRHRDSKDNKYIIFSIDNGNKVGDSFTAGTQVPEEVSNILNLSEVNYQQQLTPYFLVFDSPGQVAKYINEVTKLFELDIVTKFIADKLRGIESASKDAETRREDLEEQLEQAKSIDLISLKHSYGMAVNLTREQGEIQTDLKRVDSILLDLTITEEKLSVQIDTSKIEGFDGGEDCAKRLDELHNKYISCCRWIEDLTDVINDLDDVNEELDCAEHKSKQLAEQLITCPTCNQKLTVKAKQSLLEG